jgi:hypothetical protein
MNNEFLTALNGGRGELDAWLEVNNESEVRTAIKNLLTDPIDKCANKAKDIMDNRVRKESDVYGHALSVHSAISHLKTKV